MSEATTVTTADTQEVNPLGIPMQPINSSQLKQAGYSAEHQTVAIVFKDGGPLYEYPHIPADDWAKFLAAESQGSYFIRNWKNRTFRKFPAAQPA